MDQRRQWDIDSNNQIKEAVLLASKNSKFQKKLIFFMSFVWMLITLSAMIPSFVFMNPLFECDGKQVTEIEACKDFSKCIITNDWTGTVRAQLYCERQDLRSLIQSFYPVGTLLGAIGISALSDIIGKKKSFICALSSGLIGTIFITVGIFSKVSFLMLFGQILCGLFGSGSVILTYVMTGQFCDDKTRQKSMMTYNAIWGGLQMTFWLIYEFGHSWFQYLLYLNIIPLAITLFFGFYFIIENPIFILKRKGNLSQAQLSLEKISKSKESQEVSEAKLMLQQIYKEINEKKQLFAKSPKEQPALKAIFKDLRNVKVLVCVFLAQAGYNIFYFGVQSSLERTGFTFGFSMFLVGIAECVGFFVARWLIAKTPRKKGLIGVNIFTSLLGIAFLFNAVSESNTLQSIIISITRISCVFSYSLLVMIEMESFPLGIQSTAMGIASGMSQLGRFATPYIINKMNDIGVYPIIVASFSLLVLGVLPIFFVSEPSVGKLSKKSLVSQASEDIEQALNR